jgi:hypothetical protein
MYLAGIGSSLRGKNRNSKDHGSAYAKGSGAIGCTDMPDKGRPRKQKGTNAAKVVPIGFVREYLCFPRYLFLGRSRAVKECLAVANLVFRQYVWRVSKATWHSPDHH